MATDIPPPFELTNTVDLVSVNDSKIVSVSLYTGRAEITRLYKFTVKTGQNQVNISGLPNVLDTQSLRVEGRGAATIHDVTVNYIPTPATPSTSPTLTSLLAKHQRTQKSLDRCKKSLASLETFLGTLDVQHIDVAKLGSVMENYDAIGEKLDDKVSELEAQLTALDEEIKVEREKLAGPTEDERLRIKATVGVFAEVEGEVEIALIYAVNDASWSAGYDIRVDMQAKESPVTLIYKAAITQNTGESWEEVPLTLETATPTYGLGVPTLDPQTLSMYRPPQQFRSTPMPKMASILMRGERLDTLQPEMAYTHVAVASQGTVSATFRVPGLISIPSDGAAHNFTIVQLRLEAEMSWVGVPRVDTKTHLKANIKNASEYTLLRGSASVYVDGSFISRSEVPPSSPGESFDCPLGLDPSVRITYQPLNKKVSQTGFYSKSSNYVYTQRITIHNTKSIPIQQLKIIDQIPVSEDSQIIVKLVSPALSSAAVSTGTVAGSTAKSLKLPAGTSTPSETISIPSQVKVAEGVTAYWDGADEPDVDTEALGKDGKLNWVLGVPAQEKVNLVLQWEVTTPLKANVVGL